MNFVRKNWKILALGAAIFLGILILKGVKFGWNFDFLAAVLIVAAIAGLLFLLRKFLLGAGGFFAKFASFALPILILAVVIFGGIFALKNWGNFAKNIETKPAEIAKVPAENVAKNSEKAGENNSENSTNSVNSDAENSAENANSANENSVKNSENSSENSAKTENSTPNAPSANVSETSEMTQISAPVSTIAASGSTETFSASFVILALMIAGYFYADSRKMARK